MFCAKDVATVLGYADTVNAIKQHCKGVVKRYPLQTAGGMQQARFITEGDLYRLIANSKLPNAEKFERWVFDEVLPSIRKHGGYLTPEKIEEVLLNPDTIISLANQLKDEQAKVKKLTPKAGARETFCESSGDMSGRILLKRLRLVVVFCALIIGGLVGVMLGDVVEVF